MPAETTVTVVRILLLEDEISDVAMIRGCLERDGLQPAITHVTSKDEFVAACRKGGFEIILSDYRVPGFDGLVALDTARRLRPEVPFVFVSGVMGEEVAVESLRLGAADYVLKDRLGRLPASVRRVLTGREMLPGLQRAELALRERLFEGIAEANSLLLSAVRVADALPGVLRTLGEASAADRVWLVELGARTGDGSLRGEWARRREFSGVTAIGAGEHAPGRLALPIVVGGREWGRVGIDQCTYAREWAGFERTALSTVAANIGQAISREQALSALAESERRYEALLAGLSETIFQVDLDGRWSFLNPTWHGLTGYPVAESIGRRCTEHLAPQDAAAVLEGFGRLLSGRNKQIEAEIQFRHREGREVWFRVTAQTNHAAAGKITGVSGTLVDVTQRREAQEALRASERKFSAVFASASDALFLVSTETNLIIECNPHAAEMFACADSRQLVGANIASLQRHPLSDTARAEGRARLARGEVWSLELEYTARNGRVFWGQMAVVRMATDANGMSLVRITDISEVKRVEEQLRASLADKEVLLKEVYHRVKNNLQIISALLRMQARRVKDPTALEALENSISRVMAMSMVHEKLHQAQNLASIDFLSFAQSLVAFLNQLTVGAHGDVGIELTGEPLALSIDQAIPLGLILNELVTNSLKYAFPEGRRGRVRIQVAREADGTACVTVADNGIGFARGADPRAASGLGLRIVDMLVEQLDGRLELKSAGGLHATVRVPPPAEVIADSPADVAPQRG